MSEMKRCTECQTTSSTKFRSLKGEKWKEAENNDLVKVTWREGVLLCNICYMRFVENLLKKGPKRVKIMKEETIDENTIDTESIKVDLVRAIKVMAKILYEREHIKEEGPIYAFDEMQRLFQEIKLSLKDFFN